MISVIESNGGSESKKPDDQMLKKIAKAWKAPNPKDTQHILDAFEEALDEKGETAFHYIGLEAALLGEVERNGMPAVLCYSRERIVVILMERDGMTRKDAEEFIEYNIEGASIGERTPVLLT